MLFFALRECESACAPSRPAVQDRKFVSQAIEHAILDISTKMKDKELACIFSNTFPNTLDTTVFAHNSMAGQLDTFIITGDIEAMWLRDSMNQVRAGVQCADARARALLVSRVQ